MTGFDLDDFPIAFWFIYSINSIDSRSPEILSNSPGLTEKSFKKFNIAGYRTLLINVLLPEPETPVTVTSFLRGISKLIFF